MQLQPRAIMTSWRVNTLGLGGHSLRILLGDLLSVMKSVESSNPKSEARFKYLCLTLRILKISVSRRILPKQSFIFRCHVQLSHLVCYESALKHPTFISQIGGTHHPELFAISTNLHNVACQTVSPASCIVCFSPMPGVYPEETPYTIQR